MKIFIIDFSNGNELELKIPQDIEIYNEKIDGGRAYKTIGEIMPDLILVNCKQKPSHGLQTASSIKQRKSTSNIPILFIDSEGKQKDKVAGIGELITYDEIETYIQKTRINNR